MRGFGFGDGAARSESGPDGGPERGALMYVLADPQRHDDVASKQRGDPDPGQQLLLVEVEQIGKTSGKGGQAQPDHEADQQGFAPDLDRLDRGQCFVLIARRQGGTGDANAGPVLIMQHRPGTS